MHMYLGVDGGGTLSRALFVNQAGEILGVGQSGPSNVQQVGTRTVRANLSKAIRSALMEFDAEKYELVSACYGLAGSSSEEAHGKLTEIIDGLLPKPTGHCRVTTDVAVALSGGLIEGPGLLLIAGTGSICIGRDAEGVTHRTGGWGLLADDTGSSLWIGRKAIEFAVRQADGRKPSTPLGAAVFEELGIDGLGQIVSVLHSSDLTKTKIAQLARLVTELASEGDGAALQIVDQAIVEISDLILATSKKIDVAESDVILVGGLLTAGTWFRERLEASLLLQNSGLCLKSPRLLPVGGAILEARTMAGGIVDDAFITRLGDGIEFFNQPQ